MAQMMERLRHFLRNVELQFPAGADNNAPGDGDSDHEPDLPYDHNFDEFD